MNSYWSLTTSSNFKIIIWDTYNVAPKKECLGLRNSGI